MSPGRSNKPLFEVLSEHPPKGPLSSSLRGSIPGRDSPTPSNPQTAPAKPDEAAADSAPVDPKNSEPASAESKSAEPQAKPDSELFAETQAEGARATLPTASEVSHAASTGPASSIKPAAGLTPAGVSSSTTPGTQSKTAQSQAVQTQVEPKPTRRVELQPKPGDSRAIVVPEAELEAAQAAENGGNLDADPVGSPRPIVTIPLSTVYTAIAFAGVLVLVAWIGGYKIGFAGAERELINDSLSERPNRLTEPNGTGTDPFGPPMGTQTSPIFGGDSASRNTIDPTAPTGNASIPQPEQESDSSSGTAGTPANQPAISQANGTILAAQGLLVDDPREAGLNYLELGTFSREMTADAIEFMAAAGQPAIGIPQSGGRYRLISIGLAIPGSQWSAMRDQRSAHQRTIASIGSDWVRERQGGSDFTQTQWTKYAP